MLKEFRQAFICNTSMKIGELKTSVEHQQGAAVVAVENGSSSDFSTKQALIEANLETMKFLNEVVVYASKLPDFLSTPHIYNTNFNSGELNFDASLMMPDEDGQESSHSVSGSFSPMDFIDLSIFPPPPVNIFFLGVLNKVQHHVASHLLGLEVPDIIRSAASYEIAELFRSHACQNIYLQTGVPSQVRVQNVDTMNYNFVILELDGEMPDFVLATGGRDFYLIDNKHIWAKHHATGKIYFVASFS